MEQNPENPEVFHYTRRNEQEELIVILNFSQDVQHAIFTIPEDANLLISNYEKQCLNGILQPFEAAIFYRSV
ncbi:hypothetical protein AwErysi_01980 [Erysipelotrichaceae bacterium]|nr:hypothetical protein AwErysi_01980 [Erysipelotrichaceae bacterium]